MPFDAFGYWCLQLFIQAVVPATAFLIGFNVVLAIFAWARAVTKSEVQEV
jgi:hypothetical protein